MGDSFSEYVFFFLNDISYNIETNGTKMKMLMLLYVLLYKAYKLTQ